MERNLKAVRHSFLTNPLYKHTQTKYEKNNYENIKEISRSGRGFL